MSFLTSTYVRFGVTMALVIYAVSYFNKDDLRELIHPDHAVLLLWVAAALFAVVALNAIRWLLVARALALRIPWARAWQWTLIGHFFNQVVPSSIGGDVMRGILAGRWTGNVPGVATSIALERIVGFVALLALIVVGQPLLIARLNNPSLSWVAFLIALGALCAILLPFVLESFLDRYLPGRAVAIVRRFCNDARQLIAAPITALFVLLGAFTMHGCMLLLTAIVANKLGANVSVLDVLLIVPTIMLVASLPISIGGWGVREAGLAVGFTALGQPASVAVATSLIIGVGGLVSALPGAVSWGLLPASKSRRGHGEMPQRSSAAEGGSAMAPFAQSLQDISSCAPKLN